MTEQTIPVDVEHGGLRAVVLVLFVVMAIILFFLLSAFIPAETFNLVALLGGLLGAAGLTYVIEQQLKARWKSGKEMRLTDDGVTLASQHGQNVHIPVGTDVQLLRWRFRISRRTRVPRGWSMVAIAMTREDSYITVYTLMSPEVYETFDPQGRFTHLEKQQGKRRGQSLRLAGEQRRLHRAESVRWHEGVEMTNDNFIRYVEQLERLLAR